MASLEKKGQCDGKGAKTLLLSNPRPKRPSIGQDWNSRLGLENKPNLKRVGGGHLRSIDIKEGGAIGGIAGGRLLVPEVVPRGHLQSSSPSPLSSTDSLQNPEIDDSRILASINKTPGGLSELCFCLDLT